MRIFSCFGRDGCGNFAVITAVVAMPLLLVIGTATDYSMLSRERSRMQEISDSAALAAAAELGLSSSSDEAIKEVARAFVFAHDPELEVKVKVDDENQQVKVGLAKVWEPLLIHHISKSALPIRTTATALKAGSNNLCILALDETASSSLSIAGEGSISAASCSVYSNSTSKKGIVLSGKSKLHALSICSAGGYSSSANAMKPDPLVDCPLVPDPLVDRPFPTRNGCSHMRAIVSETKTVLYPGNYCGGLLVTNGAEVELQPGLYQFSMGPLIVDKHSKISGKFVTLQFLGRRSYLNFTNASTVELSAMKTGPTAGVLIMADQNVDPDVTFKIQSEDAKEFTGLIYLPNNKVEIGADTSKGDECAKGGIHGPGCKHLPPYCDTSFGQFSDWTAIVSKSINVNDGVDLVMNADYEDSSIPVPKGLGPTGGILRLAK